MRAVHAYADYLAVNISSPNTPGLRDCRAAAIWNELLRTLVAENSHLAATTSRAPKPLWVKDRP